MFKNIEQKKISIIFMVLTVTYNQYYMYPIAHWGFLHLPFKLKKYTDIFICTGIYVVFKMF